MNSSPDPDSRLEEWLRQSGPMLPDEGFSARVMASLPPPAAASRPVRRWLVCSVGAVGGLLYALVRTPSWPEVTGGLARVINSLDTPMALFVDPTVAIMAFVTALSLLYAFNVGAFRRGS